MDMDLEWHYVDNVSGGSNPSNAEGMKAAFQQGTFDKNCLVWNANLEGWVEANTLPDLVAYLDF